MLTYIQIHIFILFVLFLWLQEPLTFIMNGEKRSTKKKLNGLKHSVKESHRPEFWIKNIFPHIIFTLRAPEKTFFLFRTTMIKCVETNETVQVYHWFYATHAKRTNAIMKSLSFTSFGSYESNATIYIRESRSCHAEKQCRTLFSQHPLFNIQPLNPFFCFWCEHMYRVHAVNKENRRKRDESRVKQCIWIFGCCLLNDLTLNFN